MLPEARIVVGHGQMAEGQLEQVMLAFAAGEADVLVCTTIIESGLDIPNANTIIIDRADTLGLAQLYQLRGRVGRSSRRAYAYLLYRRRERMSEEARKRLQAIFNASELGAGFQIALSDLEIRGAGNILGAEQSGHMAAVGFDLYTRLLAEAVEEREGASRASRAGRRAAAGGHRPAGRRLPARRLRPRRGPEAGAVPAPGAGPDAGRRRRLPAGGHRPLRADAGCRCSGWSRSRSCASRPRRPASRRWPARRASSSCASARACRGRPRCGSWRRRGSAARRPAGRRHVRLEPGPHPAAEATRSRAGS